MIPIAIASILTGTFFLTSSVKNRNPFEVIRRAIAKPEDLQKILADTAGKWSGGGGAFAPSSPTKNLSKNGQLKNSDLVKLSWEPGERLIPAAASSLESLNSAFHKRFGHNINVVSSYRTLAAQIAIKDERGKFAANPGKSLHGLGRAIDIGGAAGRWGTKERNWLVANAPSFGWNSPAWAQRGKSTPEPWHWEWSG